MASESTLLDPSIFDYLKDKLEEESQIRETLTQIIQRLERAVASAQAFLSRVHSTPRSRCEFSLDSFAFPYPSILGKIIQMAN